MKLSNYQLFSLVVLHTLGSSTLFAMGIRAKQDAWLVVLLGLVAGFGILWIHTELQSNFPDKNLVEINSSLIGRLLGGLITLFFAAYFLWVSNLNFSEFAELISMTALQDTPVLAIQIMFALLIVYMAMKKIEVLARTGEIIMPFVMGTLIILFFLTIVSGLVSLKALQPVLGSGIKPILKEVYPTYSTFPYGENVVFLMFYCYVGKNKLIRKSVFGAILMTGLILTVSTINIIVVLGPDYAAKASIPLLEVIKMINVGNIISNLDAIGMILMFLGGLFKAILYFYGATLALSALFRIRREIVIILLSIFLVWFNNAQIPNFIFHRYVSAFSSSFIHEIYTIYIPLLLLAIVWLKKLNRQLDKKK